ncbi:TolC family protein [Pedobacter aquatilis]|uniref:TolC family protein n=1 Tax=Pedobacter aquatilis TaxID=351343 RepID=UPI00292FF846|nr:TolC family protein [Pedobacter aquatilis]
MFKKYLLMLYCCVIGIAVKGQEQRRNLSYFLNQAQNSSPVLKDLKGQKNAAGIDSLIIKATAGVQLTANAAGLYAPIIKGYGYDEVLSNGQSLEGYLNLGYDLMNKKRIQNQLESVKLQRDSLNYATSSSLFDLNRSVTDQYLMAYASQEQLNFNKDVVVLLEKENVLLKTLTRSNVYKQSEYLTFLVTLQQQQLATKQAEIQFQNDYAKLAYLSGIRDTTKTTLVEPKLQDSLLLSDNSFFLKKFEVDSMKNLNQKKAVDLNYKPKLGVFANGGYSSSLVLQPYKNFGTSVGFTFSVPIYDGHQRKMQYSKLNIANETIGNYRDFFKTQQAQQLQLIRQQIAQTNTLFSKINEQIKFSKSLVDVDIKLMHTGDLRVADFIIAINNYLSAQTLLRQTTINRLKLINQYNYWNR